MSLDYPWFIIPLVFAILGYAAWAGLYGWTKRGTEAGLPPSAGSSRAANFVKAGWVLAVFANTWRGFSDSVAVLGANLIVLVLWDGALAAWAVYEVRRRNRADSSVRLADTQD